jgi:putative endonuclease
MRLTYCVYVLISLKDKNLYVGYTTDLQERLTTHFKGKAGATAPRRPFRLIHCEYHHAKSDAKRREIYLKTSAGKAAVKRVLRDSLAEFRK